MKRILASATICILVLLYLITLILAITDKSQSSNWFLASLFCTVVLPVLLWIYMHCYDLVKGKREEDTSEKDTKDGE